MSAAGPEPLERGRTRARRLAGLAVAILVLAFLAWGLARGWDQIDDYDWRLDPGLLAAGAVVVFAGYALAAIGYVTIASALGMAPAVSRVAVIAGWAKSLLGRYVPGTVVMLASRAVLGREAGVPARITLAASVYEQTLLLTTAAVASLAFVVAYEASGVSWVLLVGAVVAGLALIHPRVFRPLSTWALRRAGREPLSEFLGGGRLIGLFLYYGAMNAVTAAGIWLLVRSAAGAEAGDLPYVGLAYLLSFTAGMLAWIVPSGLGVRDGVFALALGRDLASGVAIAVAAGIRIAQTVVELGFVLAATALPRIVGDALDRRFVGPGGPAVAAHEHEHLAEEAEREELHADHDQQDPEEEQRAAADRLPREPQDREIGRDRHSRHGEGDADPAKEV
jgi:hypothetical protein